MRENSERDLVCAETSGSQAFAGAFGPDGQLYAGTRLRAISTSGLEGALFQVGFAVLPVLARRMVSNSTIPGLFALRQLFPKLRDESSLLHVYESTVETPARRSPARTVSDGIRNRVDSRTCPTPRWGPGRRRRRACRQSNNQGQQELGIHNGTSSLLAVAPCFGAEQPPLRLMRALMQGRSKRADDRRRSDL